MAYQEINDLFRFIDADEMKVYCGVGQGVREEALLPQIQLAQNLKLKVMLGPTLYEELKADFIFANGNPNNMNDGTLNANGVNYKALYFQCFPVLVWWSAFYSVNVVAVRFEEKGLMANSSDYGDNTEFAGLKLKEDRIRKVAEEYTEALYCYLNDNFKDDAEFKEESKDEGRRFSGIYFPIKVNSCKNCK